MRRRFPCDALPRQEDPARCSFEYGHCECYPRSEKCCFCAWEKRNDPAEIRARALIDVEARAAMGFSL